MTFIAIEHQTQDRSFAVYVTGDGDVAGEHDRLFSYFQDYPKGQAYQDACAYAAVLGAKLGLECLEMHS